MGWLSLEASTCHMYEVLRLGSRYTRLGRRIHGVQNDTRVHGLCRRRERAFHRQQSDPKFTNSDGQVARDHQGHPHGRYLIDRIQLPISLHTCPSSTVSQTKRDNGRKKTKLHVFPTPHVPGATFGEFH